MDRSIDQLIGVCVGGGSKLLGETVDFRAGAGKG